MQLIHALAAGVRGAENGHAEIYARGTSLPVSYWSGDGGFEATNQVSGNVYLDVNGGAVIYVGQLVDVVVLDSEGAEVRRFVEGQYDANVEVRSPAFTGTEYDSASSTVGGPTTLENVLDSWIDSAGGPDWTVSLGGTALTIQAALGPLVGFYFNVQSDVFGATGDGTTDDRQAIQAAIDAAATAGGTVFFPAGSYRLADGVALEVPATVNLLGLSPQNSVLVREHTTVDFLVFTGGATRGQSVSGLGLIDDVQNNAGSVISITGGGRFLFDNCTVGNGFTEPGVSDHLIHVEDSEETWVTARNCVFDMNVTAGGRVFHALDGTVSHFAMLGGEVLVPAARTSALMRVKHGIVVGVHFDMDASTLDFEMIDVDGITTDATLLVADCRVSEPASGVPYVAGASGSVAQLQIAGNLLAPSVLPHAASVAGAGEVVDRAASLLDREHRACEPLNTNGDELCDFINHKIVRIITTANPTVEYTANVLSGATATLLIRKVAGAALTVSFGTGFGNVEWGGALAATEQVVLHFACFSTGGIAAVLWHQVGDATEYAY